MLAVMIGILLSVVLRPLMIAYNQGLQPANTLISDRATGVDLIANRSSKQFSKNMKQSCRLQRDRLHGSLYFGWSLFSIIRLT